MPRLVYLTDAGYHPTQYFREVLQRMDNPRVLRATAAVVVDHRFLPCGQLRHETGAGAVQRSEAAIRLGTADADTCCVMRQVECSVCWARRAYYGMKSRTKAEAGRRTAKRTVICGCTAAEMKYSEYKRSGLPIGSGVTEAGCKAGVHATVQGVGDEVEHCRRRGNPEVACGCPERRLGGGLSGNTCQIIDPRSREPPYWP